MSEAVYWTEVRRRVKDFIETKVYPLEVGFDRDSEDSNAAMKAVQDEAKATGLWALGPPRPRLDCWSRACFEPRPLPRARGW